MENRELVKWRQMIDRWKYDASLLHSQATHKPKGRAEFFLTANILSGAKRALEIAILEASAKED